MNPYQIGYVRTLRAAGLEKVATPAPAPTPNHSPSPAAPAMRNVGRAGLLNAMILGAVGGHTAIQGLEEYGSLSGSVGAGTGAVGGVVGGSMVGDALNNAAGIRHPLARLVAPTLAGWGGFEAGRQIGGSSLHNFIGV